MPFMSMKWIVELETRKIFLIAPHDTFFQYKMEFIDFASVWIKLSGPPYHFLSNECIKNAATLEIDTP